LWIFIIAYMHTGMRERVWSEEGWRWSFRFLCGKGIIVFSRFFTEGWREGKRRGWRERVFMH
jgi:hypothetical protein